jgi:hypothetical protein
MSRASPFAQPSLAWADCQIAANGPVTEGQLGEGVGVTVRVGAGVDVLVGADVSEGLTGTGVLVGVLDAAAAVAVAVNFGAAVMACDVTGGPSASASELVGVGDLPNEPATITTPITTMQSKTNTAAPPIAHIVQAGRRAGRARALTGGGADVTGGMAG